MTTARNISPRTQNNNLNPQNDLSQGIRLAPATNNSNVSGLIDVPRPGKYSRQMLTWRTPHLGYVKMYINPQNISITEGKDISSTRTKSGFVIQYAGEKLTKINLTGTTGSGGIEGINILESIYRAEQEAFRPIANALDRSISTVNLLALLKGEGNIGPTQNEVIDNFLEQGLTEAALNIFQQPFPTLASLAASIELFFQGISYRGFFESFKVDESGDAPGNFTYALDFTGFAKQGIRRNFMPWHRQPTSPANADATDLSFDNGTGDSTVTNVLSGIEALLPESLGARTALAETLNAANSFKSVGNALGSAGNSLLDLDLRNTEG